MLGVYTDDLFAEDRGLSPCLGGEEDINNVVMIAFLQISYIWNDCTVLQVGESWFLLTCKHCAGKVWIWRGDVAGQVQTGEV